MSEMHHVGTVEFYPEVYEPLKQFGVRASVWDEVLDGLFGMPFGELAPAFQELHFELGIGKRKASDYQRPEGISDAEYIHSIVSQTKEEFAAKDSNYRTLIDDDDWEYDDELGMRVKRVPNEAL
jgi:hypothetical protein